MTRNKKEDERYGYGKFKPRYVNLLNSKVRLKPRGKSTAAFMYNTNSKQMIVK